MRYTRAEHVAWRQIGDETIVVDLKAKEMFGLNPAAGILWRDLGTAGLEESEMVEEHRVLARQLVGLGLLQPAEPLIDPLAQPAERQVGQDIAAILWREELEQTAATCAFLPGQNTLCNSVPFS